MGGTRTAFPALCGGHLRKENECLDMGTGRGNGTGSAGLQAARKPLWKLSS